MIGEMNETTYYGEVYSVQETKDGGYILGCRQTLIKLDKERKLEWKVIFDFENILYSVKQTSDGNFLIACGTVGQYEHNYPGSGGAVVLVNSSGKLLWRQDLNCDNLFSVCEAEYRHYVSAGISDETAYIAKLTKDGKICWTKK